MKKGVMTYPNRPPLAFIDSRRIVFTLLLVPAGDQSMTSIPRSGLASIESIRARFPALQRQRRPRDSDEKAAQSQ